jgi:hypothetical protein
MPTQENGVGEGMASDVLLGNRVPTAMFDGDLGLGIDRLEPHLDLGDLLGRERCLPPGKGKADTRFPCDDAADLECPAVPVRLDEPPAETRLEGERAGRARGEVE